MAAPTSLSRGTLWDKIRCRAAAHPYFALALLVLAALGPFLAKPFNIDDPLFIWAARQIQAHPFNPYGFAVNWYGSVTPMWLATENPPLAAYFIALSAGVVGWSEPALHAAFLLPAVAVILGTYRLAGRFCDSPALAALVTLFTPVFWVSSTTVMCDVLMLAFWIWAVVLWVEGLERENIRLLAGAGLLIALAALTKYYGACLIPLLAAYALIGRRRPGRWTVCLLIPLVALVAYQWLTGEGYGQGMLTKAVGFTSASRKIVGYSHLASGLTGLSFVGGCLAAGVIFAPLLWRARALMFFAAGAIVITLAVYFQKGMLRVNGPLEGAARMFAETQTVFWAVGGVSVLALAIVDARKGRDPASWLLALWVLGTFFFAAGINWTVNGRSLLPMAPAVGILLARQLGRKIPAVREIWTRGMAAGLCASAALGFFVTQSDFLLALAVRQSARTTIARYGGDPAAFWYQGHWGFQYYMDLTGAAALDLKQPVIQPGDTVVMPVHNTYISQPGPEAADVREVISIPGPRWLTTWNEGVGAGFYSSVQGPLPFAFGRVPPEAVVVYRWKSAAASTSKH